MPSGARCRSGVCDCADGQTYVSGRCRPLNGLGESCDTVRHIYISKYIRPVHSSTQICKCIWDFRSPQKKF